jgi:hypothetical protein
MINQKTNNKVFFIIITITQTTQTQTQSQTQTTQSQRQSQTKTLKTLSVLPSIARYERNGIKRPIIL